MYVRGGRKLEINIPPQQICAISKGGLIIEEGVMSSEYGSGQTSYVNMKVLTFENMQFFLNHC